MYNEKGKKIVLRAGNCLAFDEDGERVTLSILPNKNSPVDNAYSWTAGMGNSRTSSRLLHGLNREDIRHGSDVFHHLVATLAILVNLNVDYQYSRGYKRRDGLIIVPLAKNK
jgi:hypothetical protein